MTNPERMIDELVRATSKVIALAVAAEREAGDLRVAQERERCVQIAEAETDASGHPTGCICWNCGKTTAIAAKIREGQS